MVFYKQNQGSPKSQTETQTWLGNSTGNADRKSTTIIKDDKTGNMLKRVGTKRKKECK